MMLWMAWSTLISALLALAALAAERAASIFGVQRRGVWLIVLGASTVISVAMAVRTTSPAKLLNVAPQKAPMAPASITATLRAPAVSVSESTSDAVALGARADDWVVQAWAIVSLVCLLALARDVARLRLRRATWGEAVTDVGRVLVAPNDGPAVVGFLHPRVVMPTWALESDASSRELMLRHEFEHLRTGDSRVLFMAALLLALAPWNIAFWFITRRLRLAIEIDCDTRVLRAVGATHAYGLMLLAVSERYTSPLPVSASLSEHGTHLEARIDAMTRSRTKRPLVAALPFVAAAGLVMATAAWTPRPAPFRLAPPLAHVAAAVVVTSTASRTAPARTLDVASTAAKAARPRPLRRNAAPRYPDDMRAAGKEGVVILSFTTDTRVRQLFDQWVAAMNDSSGVAMSAYCVNFMAACTRDGVDRFQRESGGLEEVAVRHADARTIEFSARQRSHGEVLAGIFGLARADSTRVGVVRIQWLRRWMSLDDSILWAGLRKRQR